MNITIRLAKKSDLKQYTRLLQKTYRDAYVDESIGLNEECFSKEIFNNSDTQKYLASSLEINEKQRCWLAFLSETLVGSITILERKEYYELRGFYVATKYQGKGIGGELWKLALNFAKRKDITLDIYAHNIKSIEVYKKWGFKIDVKRGEIYRHWPEWPEGLKAKSIYMRYKIKR